MSKLDKLHPPVFVWVTNRGGEWLIDESGLQVGTISWLTVSGGFLASAKGETLGTYYTEAQAKAAVEKKVNPYYEH